MLETPTDARPLLKVTDVARRLNVSLASAYNLIAGGKITGVVRLGGERSGIRVAADAVEAFIRQGGASA